MKSGLDTVWARPWVTAGAALGVMALTVLLGTVLRRLTGRLATMRAQLLAITIAGVIVGAIVAWLLAALMIVAEDQLGPILVVLVVTALVGSTIVVVASSGLGSAARRLADTVGAIEGGDREIRAGVDRRDELGRVGAALDQLTDRLAQLEADRRRLDAERALMLSSVSHDLRSPLAALRAAVDALIDGVAADPERYLRSMRADVEALASLVDDVFLLTRLEGGLHLEREPVDLAECCDEAIEALTPVAHQRGVVVRLAAPTHVQVPGNALAIGRVVRNLVDNAIRHAPVASTITVTVDGGRRPRVTVSDEGHGFDGSFADHAFDPWSRADASRSRATGGTGLGLAIARGLIDAHGGRIWIGRPPGGHVSFELPDNAEAPA